MPLLTLLEFGRSLRMPGTSERYLLNASWLIKLRWVAVIGQLLTIAAVQFVLDVEIRMWGALLIVIGLTAFSNAIFHYLFSRAWANGAAISAPWDLLLGLLMLMDILSLTTLLFASGGPTNPFSLFYFVISTFWMFRPKTAIFRKGMYFTIGGIVLTLLLLLV